LEVEEADVGVDVARELGVGVTHQALGDGQGDPGEGEEGAEGETEGMQVDLVAPVVVARDAGSLAITMESADQVGGDVEDLLACLLALNVRAKHRDEVGTQGNESAVLVLGRLGPEGDARDRTVEVEVGDPELADLVDPQAGAGEERVKICPIVAREALGWASALWGVVVIELQVRAFWRVLSSLDEAAELVGGQGSPGASGVGLLVGLGESGKRVSGQAAYLDEPGAEAGGSDSVGIAGPG
jgi:hypothetical protein